MRAGTRIVGAEEHVVVHGEKRKQPPALEDVGNADARAPVGRHGVNTLALEMNAARHRTQQPGNRVDERGLAGAVRAEKRHDFAAADMEARLPEDLELAVRNVERLERKLRLAVHATYAWPRYASTTLGLRATAAGGPSAMTSPMCSAMMRCATAVTTRMLCSITRSVRPPACSSRTSSTSAGIERWSTPPVTSSRRSRRGPVASARASSRRLRCPVESVRA